MPYQPADRRTVLSPAALVLASGLLAMPLASGRAANAQTDTGSTATPAATPAPAAADAGKAASNATAAELLEDFAHYVNIANSEMAKANANALLAKIADPKAFLATVEENPRLEQRFDEAYRRALLVPDLEPVAAQLRALYDEGRRLRARDPREIEKNINDLTGNARARLLAGTHLREAREYAVPELMKVLIFSKDAGLRAQAQLQLTDMGRDAIAPICAAILDVEPDAQEVACRVLGSISYKFSLPYLYELHSTTKNDKVRQAAEAAIVKIDGSFDATRNVSELYRDLGEQYAAKTPSLIVFPGERHQLVWTFIKGVGLNPIAVLSEVYPQVMAMRMAERSLTLDSANTRALPLWLASNYSRQLDTPEGYDNPLYPMPPRHDPKYYAVAAGPAALEAVLERALNAGDTRLARRAIEALSMTLGRSSGEAGGLSGDTPIARAMSYPDRRVQFEAAMAIATAAPNASFDGSERVVPILANAIRTASSRFAVVIAREPTLQQSIRSALEGDGYTVLPPSDDLSKVADAVAQAPGIDIVVVELPPELAASTIEQVRASARTRATPVLALMSLSDISRLNSRFASDGLTRLAREGMDASQIVESAKQLSEKAAGPRVTADEGLAYAMAALSRLDELAQSGSQTPGAPGLNVADAAAPLIVALGATKDDVRLKVAEVLSRIGQARAQSALFDAAANAQGPEQVILLGKTAASAKRFGNLLEDRQIKRLIELATAGPDDQVTAAAALMGALNLPNDRLVPLVIGK